MEHAFPPAAGRHRLVPAGIGLLVAALTGLSLAAPAPTPIAEARLANQRCLNCHGREHIAELGPEERRTMVAPAPEGAGASTAPVRPNLLMTPDVFAGGPHAEVACVDCHQDAAELPHPARLKPAGCTTSCHEPAATVFRRGVHAAAVARGEPLAPTCTTCHGGHDVRPTDHRQSRVHPLNQAALCGDCHREHTPGRSNGEAPVEFVNAYLDSVHGRALTEGGLLVAATCADCHGEHGVRPATDPASPIHPDNVPATCGQCHLGVAETFTTSIHGRERLAGNEDAPVCTSCHTAHSISRARTTDFRADIVNECGECHDQPTEQGRSLYETYRMSYHGRVTELGSDRGARCSDCHGAHDILPTDDPASRMHMSNRIDACGSCHPAANANFVQFMSHADHRDAENYPVLHYIWLYFIIVMSVTFGLFGIHCIAWFLRSTINKWRNGPAPHHGYRTRAIRRFTTLHRVNHALIIITFFGLTLTGMPILFSDQGWARVMMKAVGGVHAAGVLHRLFAIVLLGNFVAHFVGLFRRWRQTSTKHMLIGPASMTPRWKDVQDALGMVRWFLGRGEKPKFDRWTYWEKFDYWAEIFGSVVIGGTGMLLWFPEFFSQWMPGWWFNVATIIHGYEALLAVGFIFTIHFFNAHLRYEKFPVDDVMFSGTLPEEEFRHERELEYERAVASGEIESMRVPPPPAWMRPFAVTVGILAMLIGTGLVVHIVLAGLGLI